MAPLAIRVAVAAPLTALAVAMAGLPWPLVPWPQQLQLINITNESTAPLSLPYPVAFASDPSNGVLQRALVRYLSLFPKPGGNGSQLGPARPRSGLSCTTVTVAVENSALPLTLGVDESYQLVLGPTGCTLRAPTTWGALHGLESLSQVLWAASVSDYNYTWPAIAALEMQDWPRFPYRGLLVDPARRYLPISVLQTMIDGLAYDKLNVLHLHLTDDQSFPLVLPSHPEMAAQGAFHPGLTYSPAQVASLVAYAQDRGVLLVPELDTPGHSLSWCACMALGCQGPISFFFSSFLLSSCGVGLIPRLAMQQELEPSASVGHLPTVGRGAGSHPAEHV